MRYVNVTLGNDCSFRLIDFVKSMFGKQAKTTKPLLGELARECTLPRAEMATDRGSFYEQELSAFELQ